MEQTLYGILQSHVNLNRHHGVKASLADELSVGIFVIYSYLPLPLLMLIILIKREAL